LITVFDTAENIARLLPVIEPMIDTGLIAISDVELIRVQKRAASPPAASV
jgi:PII-like signaling protein